MVMVKKKMKEMEFFCGQKQKNSISLFLQGQVSTLLAESIETIYRSGNA
jgi:hypothetical protein